ncbi:MAG: hypothetical protein LBN93_06970 [Candidatus Symbiothrix sp.]|jgi:hypothetical protein|nr:hypothetical protein [Candidatus Symbiothrix sp.]
MKKIILMIEIMIFSLTAKAQHNVIIELPETYELSNIILALTEYGKTDKSLTVAGLDVFYASAWKSRNFYLIL